MKPLPTHDQKGNAVNFAYVPNQQHGFEAVHACLPRAALTQSQRMFFSDKAEGTGKVNFLALFLDLSLSQASH